MISELLVFLTLSCAYGLRIKQAEEQGLSIDINSSEDVGAGFEVGQSIIEDQASTVYYSLNGTTNKDLPSYTTDLIEDIFNISATTSRPGGIDGLTFSDMSEEENENNRMLVYFLMRNARSQWNI